MAASPKIIVEKDYDGFFENLVKQWVKRKTEPFKHHTISVYAGPWLPDAVSYRSTGGVLAFSFYAALRAGFGALSDSDIEQIIDLL